MTEADELWEYYKPGGANDQALVEACGYHGADGVTHPCSTHCATDGCWYERRPTSSDFGPSPEEREP